MGYGSLEDSRRAPAGGRPAWSGFVFYLLMLGAGAAIFLAIRTAGEALEAPQAAAAARSVNNGTGDAGVVVHVLATLAAIIALGQILGRVLRWLGQPPVIGEVIAGLVLGPSVLGAIAPQVSEFFISSAAADPAGVVDSALQSISRLGIVLYMFLVGLELNLPQLSKRAHAAVAISHASILLPFLLGAALTLWLYPQLSSADVSFTNLAMFMGVAMAITAFPVLARILTDQKLEQTELGVLALGCAAAGDVTAWCLLALVIGMVETQLGSALFVILGAVVFIAVMFVVVRPLAVRIAARLEHRESPAWVLPAVLVAVMASALATELIGLHTLFGGFLMGAIMPHRGRLAAELKAQLHDIVTVLLLPAFFAISGMRTQITLLDRPSDWLIAGVIIAVATAGKFAGTLGAARFTGISWRDSAALGILMNTRGLMELIVLNIGLDVGVISPRLFAMMVLMALVTTLATVPALRWLIPRESGQRAPISPAA